MAGKLDRSIAGLKVKKLICVLPSNRNKYYNMFEQSNGTFIACYGRVDGNESEKVYPIDKWDRTVREKTERRDEPYKDMTEFFLVEKSSGKVKPKNIGTFHPNRSKLVIEFVTQLQKWANASIAINYDVVAADVTQKQVDRAQEIIDSLVSANSTGASISELNDMLIELYTIIPRKMKGVKEHLFGKAKDEDYKKTTIDSSLQDEISKHIGDEQETLDVMAGQVAMNNAEDKEEETTDGQEAHNDLLQTMGLEMVDITPAEMKLIKEKMGSNASQFRRAFRVINKESESKFQKFVKDAKNKKRELLWHGSRSENWWSIYQQSLKIRPSNAVITGKMFGHGIYFADKAQKSINYTSSRNSYYAGGNKATGVLALYEIHQGEQLVVKNHLSEHQSMTEDKLKKKGNYDSLFAQGGYDLRNNEFIIYNESQCTLRYFVEFDA